MVDKLESGIEKREKVTFVILECWRDQYVGIGVGDQQP